MSNIKEIDGVFVNLDLVTEIGIFDNTIHTNIMPDKEDLFVIYIHTGREVVNTLKTSYKKRQEAEDRIRDILRMQNSPNIKI